MRADSSGDPPRIELVVARHLEDVRWTRRVPTSIRVTIYEKGRDVPNVGREAQTYLHHLTTRYDRLADVTVFSQGHPFDHASHFHALLRDLAANPVKVTDFLWIGHIVDRDDRTGARLFQNWSKNPDRHPLPLDAFWRALWNESPPEVVTFFPGAQFAVTAGTVRSQPVEFYRKALAISESLPDAAHCFERCWDRVFGLNGLPIELRDRPLPIYLKPIRRLQNG